MANANFDTRPMPNIRKVQSCVLGCVMAFFLQISALVFPLYYYFREPIDNFWKSIQPDLWKYILAFGVTILVSMIMARQIVNWLYSEK